MIIFISWCTKTYSGIVEMVVISPQDELILFFGRVNGCNSPLHVSTTVFTVHPRLTLVTVHPVHNNNIRHGNAFWRVFDKPWPSGWRTRLQKVHPYFLQLLLLHFTIAWVALVMLHYVFMIADIVIFLVGTDVLNCTALFSSFILCYAETEFMGIEGQSVYKSQIEKMKLFLWNY